MGYHETPTKLIIVPGHASLKYEVDPNNLPADMLADDPWVLQSFQKGEPPYYGEHIKAGVDLNEQENGDGLLVFSGGYTRSESGDRWSEAGSYKAVAEHELWLPKVAVDLAHVALDEYARDSLQNVLGGIYTFRQQTGDFPKQVVVTGWDFKKERFGLHADALGIPRQKFTYVGVNNPSEEALAGAEKGESKAVEAFRNDPLGEGEFAQKRRDRDPLGHGDPYDTMPKIQI